MNMHIKGHHITRKISSIKGSLNGQLMIALEPQPPYDCEYLIFFPDELSAKTKEIILIGAISEGEGPFSDLPGDSAGFTPEGPEIKKNTFNPAPFSKDYNG